ncbi:nucleotidyltransferase family protein [Desertivirga arenae]|uniref:nucleotidyltransferase family protein n=1 Tax=Desertivirga arenae TaxID=2810309 RepID=UPI001A97BE19|nr:nucleotidyltransferase family protein [Pedobacter sp. SYSU D00823]
MLDKVGIIILAAGNSSRLGQSKQLLRYKNKTLLRHVVEEAIESRASTVLVVLGANGEEHKRELTDLPILIAENGNWEKGMGTSIAAGCKEILKQAPLTDAVILCVCDQPHLGTAIIDKLIELGETSSKGLAACKYADAIGTPALFKVKYFIALQDLEGNQGAKVILQAYRQDLELLDFPEGAIDIDTKTDYTNLLNTQLTD